MLITGYRKEIFLPKTNCKECGQPSCLVFATLAVKGVKGAADCPQISVENRKKLEAYLATFPFPDLQAG